MWLQAGHVWLQSGHVWLQAGCVWLQAGRVWLQAGCVWLQAGGGQRARAGLQRVVEAGGGERAAERGDEAVGQAELGRGVGLQLGCEVE